MELDYRTYVATLFLIVLILSSPRTTFGQDRIATAEPKLKLQGLDGRVYDLANERGNVLLVSFGATWCAPCSNELRALEELLAEYRNQPVKFFWVSIERPEEVSDNALKRYARERKVSFPVLRDTAKMVFLQFSPRVRLPMIVMLGKNGRVDVPVQFGMRTPAEAYKADIRTRLNKLLAQPTQAEYSTRQCGDDSLTAYTGDTAPFSFLSSNKTGVGKQQAGLTMKQKIGWAERSPHCRVEH